MLKVSLGSSMDRQPAIIVEETEVTAKQLISESKYAELKGSWSLDGYTLNENQLNAKISDLLEELDYAEGTTQIALSNIPMGKNAA